MWFKHPMYRAHSSSIDIHEELCCRETQTLDLRRRTVILGLENPAGA